MHVWSATHKWCIHREILALIYAVISEQAQSKLKCIYVWNSEQINVNIRQY
jgi:hypothetical protein